MLLHLMNNHDPQLPSQRIYPPFTQHLPVWHVLGSCHMYLSPDILSWMQYSLKCVMDCSCNFSAAVFKPTSSGCLWISLWTEWYIILNWNHGVSPCSDTFAHVFQLFLKLKHAWNIFLTAPASETSRDNGITLAAVMLLFSIESTSKTTWIKHTSRNSITGYLWSCLTGIS